MAKKASPGSKSATNLLMAFLFGGGICTLGQLLLNVYQTAGLSLKDSRTLVSVTLVFIAAVLTACHVFDDIAKVAGAGTLVPITGFSNAVVSPAIEFKSEGMVMGLGAKMFVVAGPVLVYGIVTSILYGIIAWIFQLY